MSDFLKQLFANDNILVGISELSKMCNLSPRQLRYWEQKGYIQSVEEKSGNPVARKYRLFMVVKVQLIKNYMDQGDSLSKAVEKAEQKFTLVRSFRQLFKQGAIQLKVLDNNVVFIIFGPIENVEMYFVVKFDQSSNQLTTFVINDTSDKSLKNFLNP